MYSQSSLFSFMSNRIISIVVRRIDEWAKDKPAFYVEFSGGKDSAAVLAALSRSKAREKAIIVYIHIAGNTHGLNMVQTYNIVSSTIPEALENKIVIIAKTKNDVRRELFRHGLKPPMFIHIVSHSYGYGLDYLSTIEKLGIPVPNERFGKGIRWCCAEFKERWLAELPRIDKYRYIVVGVKAFDSHYRLKLWKQALNDKSFEKKFYARDGVVDIAFAPLLDLTNHEVMLLLLEAGLADKLVTYKEYKDSLNCMFCPMKSKEKIQYIIKVMPKTYKEKLRKILYNHKTNGKFTKQLIDKWINALGDD